MKNSFKVALFKWRELFGQPAYVAGTLLFPSLFFLFFALPNADGEDAANLLMGSFAAYAFLGVIFFQFGVDIANEKENPWFRFQSTLPLKSIHIFWGRVIATSLFALLAELVLVLTVLLSTEAKISIIKLGLLSVSLIIASIPFAFLARIIGLCFSARAALPITNIIYLSLAFLGGMWIPPMALPKSVQKISELTPTRDFVEIAWHFTTASSFNLKHLYSLSSWFVGLFILSSLIARYLQGKSRL
jgi:ABC-2 type transport system permease protein